MPRILIIEDEHDLLDSLVIVFEIEGYEVSSKRTGNEGLDEARHTPPDLLISDINLPGISGLEITRELRTTPQITSIPIILITAYSEPEIQQASVDAGANLLLRKPFNIDELLAVVRQLLEE
jgi:DNA-binding response OmpR family regulator